MASSGRVFNETRGYYMKRSKAQEAIDNGACDWVIVGVSVRALTLAESVEARNKQPKADTHSPLPFAEWPGLVFRPSDRTQATHRAELRMMQIANQSYICECSRCTQARELELQRRAAEAVRFMAVAV